MVANVEGLAKGAAGLTESSSNGHTHHECPYSSKCADNQLNHRKDTDPNNNCVEIFQSTRSSEMSVSTCTTSVGTICRISTCIESKVAYYSYNSNWKIYRENCREHKSHLFRHTPYDDYCRSQNVYADEKKTYTTMPMIAFATNTPVKTRARRPSTNRCTRRLRWGPAQSVRLRCLWCPCRERTRARVHLTRPFL